MPIYIVMRDLIALHRRECMKQFCCTFANSERDSRILDGSNMNLDTKWLTWRNKNYYRCEMNEFLDVKVD